MAGVELKPRQVITPMPDADPLLGPTASVAVRYLASFAMTAVATVVAVGVDSKLTIPNLSLVFVVPVIIAGVSLGLVRHSVRRYSGLKRSISFLLTSLLTRRRRTGKRLGNRTAVYRRPHREWRCLHLPPEATEAALLRRQVIVLQGYSRDLVAADNTKAIVSITSQALAALFQFPVVVMLVTEGTVGSLEKIGDLDPKRAELEAAQSSLATGTVVRGGIYPDLASRFDFWPVKTAKGQNAVIGLHSIRTNVLRRRCARRHRWECSSPGA